MIRRVCNPNIHVHPWSPSVTVWQVTQQSRLNADSKRQAEILAMHIQGQIVWGHARREAEQLPKALAAELSPGATSGCSWPAWRSACQCAGRPWRSFSCPSWHTARNSGGAPPRAAPQSGCPVAPIGSPRSCRSCSAAPAPAQARAALDRQLRLSGLGCIHLGSCSIYTGQSHPILNAAASYAKACSALCDI